MNIKIAERLRPFSHLPGTVCMIPWSPWKATIYPAMIHFENLITSEKRDYTTGWKGPILDFTVEQDLEKGEVRVFGHTKEGYRRMTLDKDFMTMEPKSLERLSLGMHKKLDWELVKRRKDLKEILPVWFRLGQMVPETELVKVGAAALLDSSHLLELFLVGFDGILAPRLEDKDHQGVIPEGHFTGSSLPLLTEGFRLIRAMFFQENELCWSFLPLSDFHEGRIIHLKTQDGDKIDFEWSKKTLRRVVVHSNTAREIFFEFPKPLKSYRLNKKERREVDKPLFLEKDQMLFIDRFEK